ncbi:MAG: amidohydrolase family protein, partial [Proteobacteria bacterium]|nr:amidohydrolase family protein [Pseudomonadota bacterium]
MSDVVVITADRAIVPTGARLATSVLAIDGAIVLVDDPQVVLGDPRATGARRIDWTGRAMVPGTVNTHNHSFQSLLRGIGDDLPFLEWRDRALYRYSPQLGADPRAMETAALFAFGEMLLHGVTTCCDFYYLNAGGNDNASATIEAARRLGMRFVMARCFYDWDGAPASYRETIPQAVANFQALHARYHDRARFLTSVMPA